MAECPTLNRETGGSSPSRGTNQNRQNLFIMIVFEVWVCRYNHFKAGAQGRHTAVTDVTVEHAHAPAYPSPKLPRKRRVAILATVHGSPQGLVIVASAVHCFGT